MDGVVGVNGYYHLPARYMSGLIKVMLLFYSVASIVEDEGPCNVHERVNSSLKAGTTLSSPQVLQLLFFFCLEAQRHLLLAVNICTD